MNSCGKNTCDKFLKNSLCPSLNHCVSVGTVRGVDGDVGVGVGVGGPVVIEGGRGAAVRGGCGVFVIGLVLVVSILEVFVARL